MSLIFGGGKAVTEQASGGEGGTMTIQFHLLDALDEIPAPLKEEITRELEAANEQITHFLPLDRLDIVVAPHPFVIPEFGLSGFANGPGRITISLDPNSPRMGDCERAVRILGTLAHEFHHVARMRSGVWASTLGGRLVSEGLAQCFEEEVGAGGRCGEVSGHRGERR